MTSPNSQDREASLAQFRAFTGGPVGGPTRERAERALGVAGADSGAPEQAAGSPAEDGPDGRTTPGGNGQLSRRAS